MSKQSFTPGPWIVDNENGVLIRVAISEDALPLALVETRARDRDRALADACLIAAAPEMLEALRKLVKCAQEPPTDSMDRHLLNMAVIGADEAIAKATGGEG